MPRVPKDPGSPRTAGPWEVPQRAPVPRQGLRVKGGRISSEVTEAPSPPCQAAPPGRGYPMVPWATLALVATNVALFCRPIHPPSGACLSVQSVWGQGQWGRLLWAPFHHLGLFHLLLNMATLLWLGWALEQEVGTLRAGALMLALALLGGLLHLGLNSLLALVTGQTWYREHCAVGFSGALLSWCTAGVLFSLEAMGQQAEAFPVATMAAGITLTTRWLCVLECLALALFYPSSSFTGHLSGLLLGLTLSSTDLLSQII